MTCQKTSPVAEMQKTSIAEKHMSRGRYWRSLECNCWCLSRRLLHNEERDKSNTWPWLRDRMYCNIIWIYSGLILCGNCYFSLPAPARPCLWAVCQVDHDNTINESTGGDGGLLSHGVMTPCNDNNLVVSGNNNEHPVWNSTAVARGTDDDVNSSFRKMCGHEGPCRWVRNFETWKKASAKRKSKGRSTWNMPRYSKVSYSWRRSVDKIVIALVKTCNFKLGVQLR